jgi:hypothetical protein
MSMFLEYLFGIGQMLRHHVQLQHEIASGVESPRHI